MEKQPQKPNDPCPVCGAPVKRASGEIEGTDDVAEWLYCSFCEWTEGI